MKQLIVANSAYVKIRKRIADEIMRGKHALREAYRREVLVTYWNIGRILVTQLPFTAAPSAQNGVLIKRLVRDFKRPDAFFYAVMKLYQLYPAMPQDSLSWSHYQLLITVDDDKERERLRKQAIKEHINAKDFRATVRSRESLLIDCNARIEQTLNVTRGELYHYRVRGIAKAPHVYREVTVDIGFGIERHVPLERRVRLQSGRIVRVVKEEQRFDVRIATPDPDRLYTYKATVIRVIDGDTLVARIDLGFRTWIEATLRLRGIDTPELTRARGRKAKLFVEKLLPKGSAIVVKTYKQEKYGRFLADVYYMKKAEEPEVIVKDGTFLNQELLDTNLATLYDLHTYEV